MRVLLVMPPLDNMVRYFKGWQLSSGDYGRFPPLGLLYVGTYLKQHMPDIELKIIDCPAQEMDYPGLTRAIKDFRPDIAGICTFTVGLVDLLETAKIVKAANKDTVVCAGGPHLAVYPGQTLGYKDIDAIVIGEGEAPFLELTRQVSAGAIKGGMDGLYVKADLEKGKFQNGREADVDTLPFYDVSLIDRRLYYSTVGQSRNMITLLSSRGCPYGCTFCDVPYKIYRERSIENIIGEIKLRLSQGFDEIFFYDDTFNMTPDRVIRLSEGIISEKLKFKWSFRGRVNTTTFEMLETAKKAGLRMVHFGVETGTDEGLRSLNKGITIEQVEKALKWCRQLRIKTIADFMIGLPFERSIGDVINNIDRLIRLSPDYAQFNILQPVPNSRLFREGVRRGVIPADSWDNFVRAPSPEYEPPLWTEHLSTDQLKGLFHSAYRKFYIRPSCIIRGLFGSGTIHEFRRVFKGGIKILLKK